MKMICDKGHTVQSWIIRHGDKKIHRVNCPECKIIIDYFWVDKKIKKKVQEYTDSSYIDIISGRIRDDDYWWAYNR